MVQESAGAPAHGGDEAAPEVLISGGGMVGLTLGIALADAGVDVVVLEPQDPAAVTDAAFDGRSSAIARGSQRLLAALGIWPGMAAAAAPILDIRVSDGRPGAAASHLFLHYGRDELAEETDEPLGYIVENRAVRTALHARAASLPALRLITPGRLTKLERGTGAAPAAAVLDDGRQLRARLVISAEGRGSPLRTAAGIRVTAWDYPQTGIVCTVAHEAPHNGVAHEHFLPAGPFALLPMTDAADGTHRSSLVWTERRTLVPAMLALDDDAFGAEMQRRFGDSLGTLRPAGRRWSHPLSLMHAERYIDHRLALVGDAAHVIHPIAGQGLNLGLRDVAALAETVVEARRLGLDPGEAAVLDRYQRWRRFDNTVLMIATDGLNRLFSNDAAPLRLARDVGLAAVNRLPPLKRLFMRHAMGLVGDLPRLIRGQAL
jgi:2-octaprenyl-6-methoxyphenol hydroxylase